MKGDGRGRMIFETQMLSILMMKAHNPFAHQE
jgi:hypothetical protein